MRTLRRPMSTVSPRPSTDTTAEQRLNDALRLETRAGRGVLIACVLGSGLAGIDSTVVNIALPRIGRDFDAGFSALQWTVSGYTVTLAALILLGGSLGDRFGRRRLFLIGVVWFAAASCLCAAAPSVELLVAARVLQGIGGALLTPASLAILQSSFAEEDRSRAIGAWSGWSGTASAIAPFLGGWLIGLGSWRWVFLINPPLAIAVILISRRVMPESRDVEDTYPVDLVGAALGVAGLGAVTIGIISASDRSLADPRVWLPTALGLMILAAMIVYERRARHPMLPVELFRSRQFSATNAVTFLLYASNAGALFLLVIELQTVSGFSPLLAGSALLPITVVMLLLAARFGALAQRMGPRLFMSVGPCIAAAGLLLCLRLGRTAHYATDVLGPLTLFGLGLAVFVAPLTSTVLSAAPATHAGVASGVNNAVARAAGLLAIAALPVVVGLNGTVYTDPHRFIPAFHDALWICAGLQLAGGLLSAVTIRNPRRVGPRGPAFCSLDTPPLHVATVQQPTFRLGRADPDE